MKRYKGFSTSVILIFAFVIFGNINLLAQKFDPASAGDTPPLAVDDPRPFDFSDGYYQANGILPGMLHNRRNGEDGLSVFDRTSGQDRNKVRILATRPAYGREGEILFWNLYAEFYPDAFTEDAAGQAAYELAHNFPIYLFPGESRSGAERQAAIIDLGENYFEKNVLGLGVVMLVEYNRAAALTKSDVEYLEQLAKQNGRSADGTAIIRTVRELDQLHRRNLITITPRSGRGQAPFIVGKVLQFPAQGALAPDAFLLYTKDAFEKPLADEVFILERFRCIQKYGNACGVR